MSIHDHNTLIYSWKSSLKIRIFNQSPAKRRKIFSHFTKSPLNWNSSSHWRQCRVIFGQPQNLAIALFILLLMFSCTQRVIYDSDNRKEWYEYDNDLNKQIYVNQVACLIRTDYVKYNSSKRTFELKTARIYNQFCPEERFKDQPSIGFCTAFPVANDIVATAAHCLDNISLDEFYVVFGFRLESPYEVRTEVNLNEVYTPVDTVAYENGPDWSDYTLLKVDKVIYQYKGSPLRKSVVQEDEIVSVAGYPLGLPVKIADSGKVIQSDPNKGYYLTNLDTYKGNSGSPVYDVNDSIVGMLVGGSEDFQYDSMRCLKSIVCPDSLVNTTNSDSACIGEKVIKITRFAEHLESII